MKGSYKESLPFEERKKKHRMIALQRNSATVVFEKEKGSKLPVLKITSLSVPRDWRANRLKTFLMEKLKLGEKDCLFLYIQRDGKS
jgi:hypothetical protein